MSFRFADSPFEFGASYQEDVFRDTSTATAHIRQLLLLPDGFTGFVCGAVSPRSNT